MLRRAFLKALGLTPLAGLAGKAPGSPATASWDGEGSNPLGDLRSGVEAALSPRLPDCDVVVARADVELWAGQFVVPSKQTHMCVMPAPKGSTSLWMAMNFAREGELVNVCPVPSKRS